VDDTLKWRWADAETCRWVLHGQSGRIARLFRITQRAEEGAHIISQ
jgi:hypothetical protein